MKSKKEFKIIWGEDPYFFGPRDYFKNTLIVKKVKNFLKSGKNVLDFGCGCGNLAIRLANLGYYVTAYDISPLCLKILEKRIENTSLRIKIVQDEKELIKMENSFDCICAGEVLEHIKNDRETLILWQNLLKNKGLCIITVPAKQKYWDIGDEAASHFRRYEKGEIINLFKITGFKIKTFYCFGPITFFWHKFIFIPVLKQKLMKRAHLSRNLFKMESLKKFISYIFYFDFLFLKFNIWNSYLIVAQKNEK
jgi:ubiquinone/menaquinone biosynthesis C-methylase UbiE